MFSLLLTLAIQQDASDPTDATLEVGRLVGVGRYVEAVSVAQAVHGAEGASLEVWVRHHAGDLAGAISLAEDSLAQAPQHAALLEQAAYISASLFHGAESLSYARRLSALGHPNARNLEAEAQALLESDEEVTRGSDRALYIVCAFSLLAAGIVLWGARPISA